MPTDVKVAIAVSCLVIFLILFVVLPALIWRRRKQRLPGGMTVGGVFLTTVIASASWKLMFNASQASRRASPSQIPASSFKPDDGFVPDDQASRYGLIPDTPAEVFREELSRGWKKTRG